MLKLRSFNLEKHYKPEGAAAQIFEKIKSTGKLQEFEAYLIVKYVNGCTIEDIDKELVYNTQNVYRSINMPSDTYDGRNLGKTEIFCPHCGRIVNTKTLNYKINNSDGTTTVNCPFCHGEINTDWPKNSIFRANQEYHLVINAETIKTGTIKCSYVDSNFRRRYFNEHNEEIDTFRFGRDIFSTPEKAEKFIKEFQSGKQIKFDISLLHSYLLHIQNKNGLRNMQILYTEHGNTVVYDPKGSETNGPCYSFFNTENNYRVVNDTKPYKFTTEKIIEVETEDWNIRKFIIENGISFVLTNEEAEKAIFPEDAIDDFSIFQA